MSSGYQQPPQQTVIVQQASSNGLGTAGLIVSLVGFLTCGFISPIGLLLSFAGLFKPPRGSAIAGVILGGVGSLWLVLGGFALVAGLFGLGAAVNEAGKMATMAVAASEIRSYYADHGELPTEADGNALIANRKIGDIALRYRPLADDEFEIRSAGADSQFDTADDRTITLPGKMPETSTFDEPAALPEPESGESEIDVSP